MSLTVGQLAKLCRLSVRVLHHFDEIGLLCPSSRSESGYRLYSDADVERLHKIQALRWLELPLEEIKEILDRGSPAIERAIDEKIAALNAQIETASDMRARLTNLRAQFARTDTSFGTERMLGTVELYKHYEKHFSTDELNSFKTLSDVEREEWRQVVEDAVSAAKRNVAPDSDEAQSIAYRWGVLTYKLVNGDMTVALKTKVAYENDAAVRRSMTAVTGVDPTVMKFVLDASHHAHLNILAKYFAPADVARLNLSAYRQGEWLRVASSLKEECAKQSPVESEVVQRLLDDWTAQFNVFTGGDEQLRRKLVDALRTDPHLQKRWLVDAQLFDYVERAASARVSEKAV